MLFCCMVPWENFHHIVKLFFIFWTRFFYLQLLVKIQYSSANNEIFLTVSFCQPLVINLQNFKFHLSLFIGIIFWKFHFSQEKFSFIIVLELKIFSEGHISYNLSSLGFWIFLLHIDSLKPFWCHSLPFSAILLDNLVRFGIIGFAGDNFGIILSNLANYRQEIRRIQKYLSIMAL